MKISQITRSLLFAGLGLLLIFSQGQAGETPLKAFPERIILNITQSPYSSQAITWRTRQQAAFPRAQVIRASELFHQGISPNTVGAHTTAVDINNQALVYHHSVILNALEPDVLYAYRVGDDDHWSEWNQFKTASDKPEPFTFIYFGDIQEQVHSMCSQIFRAAFQEVPESKFWLFAGDMVDNGPDDDEWEGFFNALGWIPRTMPLTLLPGNHEYPDRRFIPPEDYHITNLWRPHFTLPENGPKGLAETVFSFEYQGVCFVMLNGNEQMETQAAWLKKTLSMNRQPWIIVAIHQPVYSISERRDRKEFQNLLVPVFDQFSVDIVLQGHDHGYARTIPLRNNQSVSGKEKGTVYVISNAGPKFYPPSSRYDHLMAKTGGRQPLFQSIRVEGDILHYTSYNYMKQVFDVFEIRK